MQRTIQPVIRLLLAGLLFALSWGVTGARAADLVIERAWLEDNTGSLSWDDVRQLPMKPLQGVLSLGYGDGQAWMRLRIDPTAVDPDDADRLYLRIRPMYLDEIELFDPLQVPARRPPVGDRHPVSAQAMPASTFLFELPVGQGPRDIWLRVSSTSTRLIHADVFTPPEMRLRDTGITLMGALYLGLITMFFLWGLGHTLIRPEPLMVSFLIYQGSWLMLGACFLGYPYLYLSDAWPAGAVDRVTNALIVVSSASVVVFSHCVLNELGPARWRRNFMLGVLATYPLMLVAVLTGHVRGALNVNMFLILVVPVVLCTFAAMSRSRSHQASARIPQGLSKPIVMGFFGMTAASTLLTALPALGLVQGVELSLYVVFVYSLVAGILMVLMLQYRAWQAVRQQSEWRAMADEAKARADQERVHREERERLLAMLGHELKTPLAAMRMLIADEQVPSELARRFDESVGDITHVVDLAVQSGQVEAGGITLRLQEVSLQSMIQSVARELPGGERVVLEIPDARSATVMTDSQMLKVIVRNLLDNALKYGPPKSPVRAVLDPVTDTDSWSVSVINPVGRAGLPDAQRVFEKYYRSPKASHRSGTGLGLYLVQGLVKLLGAQLNYAPGEGMVRFTLTLPRLPIQKSVP